VQEDASMQDASSIIRERKIRMLPVLKNGKLVGVVSDSDLKRASASDATLLDIHELLYLISKVKVRDIMTPNPVTIPDDYTVEEAALIFMEKNISGAPVTDSHGKLTGVITRYDIFKTLVGLSGFGKGGIQLAFEIEDVAGSIKLLTDVIRQHGGRLASILSTSEYAREGKRIVYIRVYGIDRREVPDMLPELRQKGVLIYMIDHRDNTRQIFENTLA
jgi:acetoin utilization protein AcuB